MRAAGRKPTGLIRACRWRFERRRSERAAIAVATMLALGGCQNSANNDAREATAPITTIASTVASVPVSTRVSWPALLVGDLPAGTATYELRLPQPGSERLTMTATLPAGWTGVDGWVLRKNGGVDNREGVAITFWGAPHYVYGDACRWADSAIEAEPTIDFMAHALAAQAMRDASTPRELTMGKHRVIELQLSVPDDLDLATCDLYKGTPSFQSWASADGSTARYHQGPGQRDLVRLVDVDGELFIVDVMTWPELPPSERDESEALLDSMTFELAQP
jgi:hypothetical protein